MGLRRERRLTMTMHETTAQTGFDADDIVLPFHVAPLDTRGRAVRLGPVLDSILARHQYPDVVKRLLAEAIALTALMGASLKFDGRFQLQTRSDGPVNMLVVDFSTPADLRAYARFDAERLDDGLSAAALLGTGHLAFTIEQTALQSRYQGIVALEGQGLEAAATQYFRQSEQIPSVERLGVAEQLVSGPEGSQHRWRAGGILGQFLPAAPERMQQADLDPGDAPPGTEKHVIAEDDAWLEARALIETTEAIELVDPDLSLDRLLYRLFHERGVSVTDARPLVDQCRCSEEKIRETLGQFGAEEVAAMRGPNGEIAVTCEFCARSYRLSM